MVRRLVHQSECHVLILCLLLIAGLAPVTPGLLSPANLTNLAGAMMPLLLVACGQTIVLVGGGIDLSATAVIALASVTGARIMTADGGWLAGHDFAVPAAVAAMLITGAVAGIFNGLAIARLRLPAFIVTLTTMMAVSGLAMQVTQSKVIGNLPASFLSLGQRLPVALAIGVSGVWLAHIFLTRSVSGQWLQAAGYNPRASHVAGIPVQRVVILSYMASGLSAGAAAILFSARLETGSPVMGQMKMLDILGAAVIGGTSLFGGRGSIIWTVSGVLFLSLLDNALNLLGLSYFVIMVVKGFVIVGAAALDTLRRRIQPV